MPALAWRRATHEETCMHRARVGFAAIVLCTACSATLLAQTPAPADGWVVLPIDEYRALRERAMPPAPPPLAPPVDATLTRLDYELRVDSDSVAGRAMLAIDVLKDGWTRGKIPAGLMARTAGGYGQSASLGLSH